MSIYLVHNFTENRENIFVKSDGNLKGNDSIPEGEDNSLYRSGQNVLFDYPTSEFHIIINGKDKEYDTLVREIELEAIPACDLACQNMLDATSSIEDFYRYWSDLANWDSGRLPEEGEDVIIKNTWNMVLDIEETPEFRLVSILGRLTFSDEMDVHLHAKHISLRSGEWLIGTKDEPYQHEATISLHGLKEENAQQYAGAWYPGSKMIANAGLMQFYGIQRPHESVVTRLRTEVFKNDR